MSVSAGSIAMSARPLSAFSACRQRVEHPHHVGQHARAAAPRGRGAASASSASYAASSRTGGRASTASCTHRGAAVLEQLGDRGVRRPGEAELLGVGRARRGSPSAGDGERRAAAAGVRRAGAAPPARPRSRRPAARPSRPRRRAPGKPRTSWPARVWVNDALDACRTSTSSAPVRRARCRRRPRRSPAANCGRSGSLSASRSLPRACSLPALVDDPVRRPQVLGHLGPVPGLARHDDAGRRAAASARARRAAAPRPAARRPGTRAPCWAPARS